MSDMKFKIGFDLGSTLDITAAINKQVFPLLSQAVSAVAQATAANWQQSVYQAKLWQGEKDQYAQSITWKMTGDFSAVVEATYPHAEEIESGRPPRDLKKMLGTSLKVRRSSKDGARFLIIPFRHNTPGSGGNAMPTKIYDLAKAMEASKITGVGTREVGQVVHISPKSGMTPAAKQTPFLSNRKTKQPYLVRNLEYQWGDRLGKGLAPKLKPEHKSDPFAGMVKMDTSTPGGAKSSAYLTFRVMSEKSKGWILPAQPGQHLAQKVTEEMQPKAQQAFAMAIKKQLSK